MIDDEEPCLSSMELLLHGTPYSLIKADSGGAGLQILKNNPNVDIVMLDLMMPDLSGLEVLSAIRKDPQLANLHVILQSGTSDFSEIKKAEQLGIIRFIKKPYNKDTVLQALEYAWAMGNK
jgi:two-component system sensor histidine kinase ChiS